MIALERRRVATTSSRRHMRIVGKIGTILCRRGGVQWSFLVGLILLDAPYA